MGAHAVSLGERFLRTRRARQFVHRLPDGLATTVYVATYPRRTTRIRVAAPEPAQALRSWSRETGVQDALAAGFHLSPAATPLGELWIGGEAHMCIPFDAPWDACRSCITVDRGDVQIAPRGALPSRPRGDLLQAGPLLVLAGRPLIGASANGASANGASAEGASAEGASANGASRSRDPEGFAAGAHQFDSDITAGRHPRAAFGLARDRYIALVCDGRSMRDAGMTLGELAVLMADLGAETAINLAGGGSASLVCGGRLQNRPRETGGVTLLGGRPVASALVFGR